MLANSICTLKGCQTSGWIPSNEKRPAAERASPRIQSGGKTAALQIPAKENCDVQPIDRLLGPPCPGRRPGPGAGYGNQGHGEGGSEKRYPPRDRPPPRLGPVRARPRVHLSQ